MKRTSFGLPFFVKKTKLLKNGEAPVRLRITVNGISAESQIRRSLPVVAGPRVLSEYIRIPKHRRHTIH